MEFFFTEQRTLTGEKYGEHENRSTPHCEVFIFCCLKCKSRNVIVIDLNYDSIPQEEEEDWHELCPNCMIKKLKSRKKTEKNKLVEQKKKKRK